MLKKILSNVQKETGKCFKDPRECLRGFLGMFGKISGNVQEDSGQSSRRFWRILLV